MLRRHHAWIDALWKRSLELRFLAVGVINTGFGYGSFWLLYTLSHGRLHYLIIQLLSHVASVTNAFVWHRRVTFRSAGAWWPEFVRFNLSYLGTLALGLIALPALIAGLGLHPLVAAAIVMLLTMTVSFFAHRGFSFRRAPPAPDPPEGSS